MTQADRDRLVALKLARRPERLPGANGWASTQARLGRFKIPSTRLAFLRHGGIYRSDGSQQHQTWGREPPPVGRPRAPVKDATGGTTRLLIVRDEFRPAIPRSGCSPAVPVSASPASRA